MCKESENQSTEEEVPDIIESPDLVRVQESADIPNIKSEHEE